MTTRYIHNKSLEMNGLKLAKKRESGGLKLPEVSIDNIHQCVSQVHSFLFVCLEP